MLIFKYYKQFIIVIFLFIIAPNVLAANLQDAFNSTKSFGDVAVDAGYKISGSAAMPDTIIGNIIAVILSFVGVIFFILMIYGGFTWMMARGNEQQVEKSKNLIYAAIIGMIIIFAAYAISYLLIKEIGGPTLLPPIDLG